MMSSNLGLIYSEFNFNVLSDCENTIYLFENYRLDVSRKMLYRDGEELTLPPKAVETLAALLKKHGEIVGKDELMGSIWTDTVVEESNLAQYLHILRKTFGNRADGKPYIETLRRRGYRFNPVGKVSFELRETDAETNKSKDFGASGIEKEAFFPNDTASFHSSENFKSKSGRRALNQSKTRFMAAAFTGALIFGTLAFVYYQKFLTSSGAASAQVKEISVVNLTNNSGLNSAVISRDGKYFAYFEFKEKKYRLYLQQTGQPNRLEIIPPMEKLMTAAAFSPDGAFVYFVVSKNDSVNETLYRVPSLGGVMTEVLDGITSPVSFAPDGSEMVFARYLEESRETALVIAASDGSRERILLKRGGTKSLAQDSAAAWSPDGKTIAFGEVDWEPEAANGRCSIIGVDIQTGTLRSLSGEKWDTCFRMDWTRNGEGLIFVGTRAGDGLSIYRDQIYYLSMANGESRRITSSDGSRYDSYSVSVTNDNALVATPVNRLSQIYKVETDDLSASPVRLTSGQADGRGGIAPLPGSRLAYASRTGEKIGIWTMNADGSERKQIFNEFSFLEELRATPDGKYLIFAAKQNAFSHLFRIDAAGGNLKQITDGKSYEVDSTVSPDSRWIFYVTSIFENGSWKTQLRKTSIDAGETVSLCDVKGEVAHLSPDGKFVSLVGNDKLWIYSAQNCELLKSFDALKASALNTGANWTPDGKALVYPVADDQDVVNLWLQPVNGDAPRPLTKFTNGSIYFHAFARDGKTLYLARGEQIRNAVLIKNFK